MHGRLMTVLAVLNASSILLVMGPSLFSNLGAAAGEILVISFPLTLLHHSIGLVAEILAVALIFKKFGKVRIWMRITFTLWLVALLFGISFYVMYYVAYVKVLFLTKFLWTARVVVLSLKMR